MKNKFKIENLKLKIKNGAGFTLIELLIFMGIFSIFLITLTDIFVSILNVHSESESTSSVEQDGRYIMQRLAYDVSRATSITTPASLGGTSSTLAVVIGGQSYTYSVNSGNFQLVNDLGTNNLNSSESTVSTTPTSFQRIGNSGGKDTIKISLTVTSKTQRPSGAETKTFQTTVARR